jgi:16S rRNA pseudouridine516 synthase
MRLDRYLSKALQVSRAEAIEIIKNNNIEVNGLVIKIKQLQIQEDSDIIAYNGVKLDYHEFVYYMLNKPAGVVSAVVDNRDKTVVDLVPAQKGIFPVGRLDKDVEGLLILTNNGSLGHALTSPKHEVVKRYYVQTSGELKDEDITAFENGVEINDGNNIPFITKPAKLEILNDKECYISISEGKFHQVKRMFIAINNSVEYLKRVAMGGVKLDPTLATGDFRPLTIQEIKTLKETSNFIEEKL